MVWPYILSGVLTAIACVGVQAALGGQPAVAAVAPQAVPAPTQWQQQNVYVQSDAAVDQQNMDRALYAVWVANYGAEKANDLLHASGMGRAAGEPGSASGGEGRGAGRASGIAGRSGDGSGESERGIQHVHD